MTKANLADCSNAALVYRAVAPLIELERRKGKGGRTRMSRRIQIDGYRLDKAGKLVPERPMGLAPTPPFCRISVLGS